ncbi:MAG: response regulator, partial [Pseudomonadota bacterium]
PRVDRLFAQDGPEAQSLFRLCRAANSGGEETAALSQVFSNQGRVKRRRFEVRVRPANDDAGHVVWRLTEIPEKVERSAGLDAVLTGAPAALCRLDQRGNVAWMNDAARDLIGAAAESDGPWLAGDLFAPADDETEGDVENGPVIFDLAGAAARDGGRIRIRAEGGGALIQPHVFAGPQPGKGYGPMLWLERAPAADEETGAPNANASGEAGASDVSLSPELAAAPFGTAIVEGLPAQSARILAANPVFQDMFSAAPGARLGALFDAGVSRSISACMQSRPRKDGAALSPIDAAPPGDEHSAARLYVRPLGGRGRGRRAIIYAVDASERRQIEAEYAQAQKMSAVGQLAGGVAHDFNNILTVIFGNCDTLIARHRVGDPSYPFLVEIQQSGRRAAELVRKLLAFSRKQTLQPQLLSIADVLQDFSPFLRRTLGEKVRLTVVNGRGVPPVKADKVQLETAIMNLAVNARDAMPGGGAVRIRTESVSDPERLQSMGAEPGDYALIEVSDTGGGVPADIAEKIFEPFFTTKDIGKGTGLGLSTVYGIVRQTGGHIFLHSPPGEGASFRILLPASDEEAQRQPVGGAPEAPSSAAQTAEPASAPQNAPAPSRDLTGRGRLLVVEDEDPVRKVVVRLLESRGYDVSQASDGEEALEMIRARPNSFDLVVSDVMMPGMDGPTLVAEARPQLEGAKIIFMSGYAEGALREQLAVTEGMAFLAKPFTLKALSELVKDVLSSPAD